MSVTQDLKQILSKLESLTSVGGASAAGKANQGPQYPPLDAFE